MTEVQKRYTYCIIFILYTVLLFIVGYHHEPWGDEAQAWLIARDNSLFNIITDKARYEGHPFLWFFILKIFINTHIASSVEMYRWLFVIPWFFSSVGIYLFLFKSKFPMWIKILFPFTYYVFYQYGVIARNPSLVFPILAIIAIFYHKRFEHPYVFVFMLFLLANISTYSYTVASSLFLFFIYDIFKNKRNFIKRYIIPVIITFIMLLITFIFINKMPDCTAFIELEFSYEKIFYGLCAISQIFFPIMKFNKIKVFISILLILIFYWGVMKVYCKNTYQKVFFMLITLPVYLVYLFLLIKPWHYGYILLFIIFAIWVLTDENNTEEISIKQNIVFYIGFLFIFGYYITGTIQNSIFDINEKFCSSKDVAKFIKDYNLTKYEINGYGIKSTAINPYFEKNIFKNYPDISNWTWKESEVNKYNELSKKNTPIIIMPEWELIINYNDYIDKIKQDYYDFLYFGTIVNLNYKNGNYETSDMHVFIDKNTAKEIPGLTLPDEDNN